MGLGLHGGGVASARFLVQRGANLLITDLRDAETLKSSIETLETSLTDEERGRLSYRLAEHRDEDFLSADFIVKNPAVRLDNRYVRLAKVVESDLTLFFKGVEERGIEPTYIGVTGSKGKSTTVCALEHILKRVLPEREIFLGGNITRSPLTFIEEITSDSIVILELSSWQLRDLRGCDAFRLHFGAITNLFHEHQDAYLDFQEYFNEKAELVKGLREGGVLFLPEGEWGERFSQFLPKQNTTLQNTSTRFYTVPNAHSSQERSSQERSWEEVYASGESLIAQPTLLRGEMNQMNLRFAALLARSVTGSPQGIAQAAQSFGGIPHRLEMVSRLNGIEYCNDSASTMPEAVRQAVLSFEPTQTILILGGKDKKSDYTPLLDPVFGQLRGIFLLAGSAAPFMEQRFRENGVAFESVKNLEEGVRRASAVLQKGETLLFSPGSSSFEQYNHEFERGDAFKALVLQETS